MTKKLAAFVTIVTVGAGVGVVAAQRKAGKDVVKSPPSALRKGTDAQYASPLDFELKDIDGKEKKLADFKGQVVMMVNVASRCRKHEAVRGARGGVPQVQGPGLVVVGIPANNFGGQEPGTEAEIKHFCTSRYDVSFPMMSKISVEGEDKHPLYEWLTSEKTNGEFAGEVEWNFAKFLVDRNGNVIGRFDPKTQPQDPKVVGGRREGGWPPRPPRARRRRAEGTRVQ